MDTTKRSHHVYGGSETNIIQQGHSSYWKRAHRDWRIWVAALLMIAGMIIYVMSNDFALRFRRHTQLGASHRGEYDTTFERTSA